MRISPRPGRPTRPRPALTAAALALLLATPDAPADDRPDAPLKAPAFTPLPLGAIRPAGWLEAQLKIQASGLSGHLDEFWPDIKDSAWTGGKAEGWERAPYWLDGIVPLGVLLDDEALQAKAKRFIDHVLAHQHDDGWLGPVSDGKHPPYDPWPLYVLFKALTQYQEATGDPRIIPAMTKCLKKIDQVITETPLTSWARFRAADLIVSIDWLYEQTREAWLLDLARKVHDQGFDWPKLFADFPYTEKSAGQLGLDRHGVNVGMAIKAPGVWWRHSGAQADRDAAFTMLDALDRYHGQATGTFTCDEHLAGRDPSQGTELCTVVEEMYSLELLAGILGEVRLADRLERIAFNALPATFKPDMCAHQYDQQANQVVCKLSQDRLYVSNNEDANLFGLEPNFGCCTANMHQGWPKFAAHLWMAAPGGGLAAVAYAPCRVEAKAGGQRVQVEVQTDYPFAGAITVRVTPEAPAKFPLLLRIPSWTEEADVRIGDDPHRRSVKPGTFHRVEREWRGPTEVVLRLPMPVRLWRGARDGVAIVRGPLVYALRVGAAWKRLRGEPPFADWEVYPTTAWNYALQVDRDRPGRSIAFEARRAGDRPFSPEGAPVIAKVRGRLVPWWMIEHNAAGPVPPSPVESDQPLEELTLVPYGCTSLRVTEFPTLK